MSRPKIKICGITTIEQGVAVSGLGADALGFILYPKSPRYIEPAKIKSIVDKLPPFIKTVGVVVNEPLNKLVTMTQQSGVDLLQLSGEETPEYCEQLTTHGITWIKAFRLKNSFDLKRARLFGKRYFLLDAWSADDYGGTGKSFDWGLLEQGKNEFAWVLAGGINIDNVEQAINKVHPYAIDVSSGVEISPGIKSLDKVKQLIAKVNATT